MAVYTQYTLQSYSGMCSAREVNDVIGRGGDVEDALEDVIGLVKCKDATDVSAELLMKLSKTQLSDCLHKMTGIVVQCRNLLQNAAEHMDDQKNAQISLQKQVIEQQSELLKNKSEQLEAVQATVKTEIRSYCDVAKKCLPSSGSVITAEQVKKAVKSAVEEDDRTRNIMMFCVVEDVKEELETKVLDILEQVDEKPRIAECIRVGEAKPGVVRPIKVTVYSADTAHRVLSKSGRLKEKDNYRSVFLSPDRTVTERATHRKLVEQLKLKRGREPELYHFIRNDTICSRSKVHDTDKT